MVLVCTVSRCCTFSCNQDHLLPYMADDRHCPDTLFFVAESDFRFFSADCTVDHIAAAASAAVTPAQGTAGPSGQSLSPGPGPSRPRTFAEECDAWMAAREAERLDVQPGDEPGSLLALQDELQRRDQATESLTGEPGSEPPRKQRPPPPTAGVWTQQNTDWMSDPQATTQELHDLVQMCTIAHRHNVGGLVWLSWNACGSKPPARYKKQSIAFGSQLIAVSHIAAKQLLELVRAVKPGHWDIVLKNNLVATWAETLKACYAVPPIGNFDGHESGCTANVGFRNSCWGLPWCKEGTRLPPGDWPRFLAAFSAAPGPATVIKGLSPWPPPDTSAFWRTQAPPSQWYNWDEDWWRMLLARGWVQNNEWLGPQKGRPMPKGPGKGTGAQKGAREPPHKKTATAREVPVSDQWTRLVQFPDAITGGSSVTPLARELVCDHPDLDWNAPQSDRLWRARRKNQAMYERRFFWPSVPDGTTDGARRDVLYN